MKKKLFLIPALALLFASCSSDEPVGSEPQKPEYAAANSYLNINLRNANGMSPRKTRAEVENPYDYTYDDNKNGGTYEDGTGVESKITHVRFYFFNDDGDPFEVRLDVVNKLYDNFVDWYPNATEFGDPNHPETVEQTLNATLGLTFTDEEERPSKVIAVANPTSEILAYVSESPATNMSANSMSLQELQGIVTNYLPANDKTPFVMSNSVYVDNNEAVYATTLEINNFQPTPAEAQKEENVVKIYIERVLARVDFGIANNEQMKPVTLPGVDGTFYLLGEYTLNDGAEVGNPEEDEEVYVKFLGWNVTSTTAESRLIKAINPAWGADLILGQDNPWYLTQLHRSFWAINPKDVEFNHGNFGNVSVPGFTNPGTSGQYATALDIPKQGEFTITYLQENANPFTDSKTAEKPDSASKVIIAAQLVGADGQPLTICQYQNVNYTLKGLKNQLAKALRTLYYQTEVDGEDAWAQIDADMLTFTTVDPAGKLDGDKEYNVYAVLTTDAEAKTWAFSNDGKTFTELKSEDPEVSDTSVVNTYIRSQLTSIMIWNSGLTYYYFDIEHLGNSATNIGYVGIVRNHIYRTTVTGVKGLGTPVYNPGLVIHPEKTESEETVIQFVIEPLSWRLVSSEYELNWE